MSPEERQMLSDLFTRVKSAAATPRDSDAETLINQSIRDQPYAPYFLAQAVIVQDHGLQAAAERIKQLEARVTELEQAPGNSQSQSSGGFLGGLGSLFGAGSAAPAEQSRASAAPAGGPWQNGGQQGRLADDYARSMPPQPQQPVGPWNPQPGAPSMGGSFLRGALGTAAGVAGGVLLADSLSSLFSPHMSGLGMGGLGAGGSPFGLGGTPEAPVEETVINNNYFGNDGDRDNNDQQQDDQQDVSDDQDYDDSDDNNDGSFDV